ncbi:hypothetical protein J1605_006615 [Eschrichtius robustus]|uniref:Uncharacterized protein n=1 Tax=Eschrichtius robustus TaxID=9764 RepID=A0AB34H557_ESCRO|nr:hypothetical protein J1605_006615 [Eschrichtius robustus]
MWSLDQKHQHHLASSGNLLEMQIHGPHLSPTESETLEILKEGLQKYTYPPETAEDFETENAFPPIEVMLEVHENVIFFENPVVARWDAEGTAMS